MPQRAAKKLAFMQVAFPQRLKPAVIRNDLRRGLKPRPFKTRAALELFKTRAALGPFKTRAALEPFKKLAALEPFKKLGESEVSAAC